MLLRAPAAGDLDQFRNAYYYDDEEKKLYVHCSDGLPATSHCIEGTVRHDYGLILKQAKHVRVEGLVIQGHFIDQRSGHGFGLSMQGTEGCVIRDCAFLNNAGGATFNYGCKGDVVRDCLFAGNNDPLYGELAQLYFSSGTKDASALNNVVLDAETHGVRFYNGAEDCTAIGNIIKNARIGLYFKSTKGARVARGNVAVGCSYFNFGTGENPGPMEVRQNTFREPSWWNKNNCPEPDASNLIFGGEKSPDPLFCDPDHLDYRLQADSPFRGKGENGADPGAFPFKGDVFFVGPQGNDANDGLCVARAWRSLAHACGRAKAGDTVYLLPGQHEGPLRPAQSGHADRPILFRGRGKDVQAEVAAAGDQAACDLSGRAFVTVENVRFTGAAPLIAQGARPAGPVTLRNCVVLASSGPALRAAAGSDLTVDRCLLSADGGPALESQGVVSLVVTNTALLSTGKPALQMDGTPAGRAFLEYNLYFTRGGAPLLAVDGKGYADIGAWRKESGLDAFSLAGDPRLHDQRAGSLRSDSPLIGAGQYGRHIGPGEAAGATAQPTIADLRLCQATPTTASFTWWTPQTSSALWRSTAGWWVAPPQLSKIRYGETEEMKAEVFSYGDLYHRVTLFDLKPGTEYFYQVELVREGVQAARASFRTPAAEAWKPARRTLYVSPSGGDANDGLSPKTAWRTIAKAGEEALAGDTIKVADGVYQETFAPVATGVEGAPIVFMSEAMNAAVMDGSNCHRPSAVGLHHKAHVVVDGFVFRFFAPKNLGRRAGYDYAQALMWGCRNITVQNCLFFGPGKYGQAGIMKWNRDIVWKNNVIMSFESGLSVRENDGLTLLNNTFYVPLIGNMNVGDSRFVMKNNLFFGQDEQKYSGAKLEAPRNAQVDYNAFGFNANDKRRYIGGRGAILPDDGGAAGLAGWRDAKAGNDSHSIEATPEEVAFAKAPTINTWNPEYAKFWLPYVTGKATATLALFDLPADSRLNTAGEGGGPIGARSRRLPLPE
jgi:hypothetical protein